MLGNDGMARSARAAAELIRTSGWFKAVDPYSSGVLSPLIRFPKTHDNKCYCPVTAMPERGHYEVIDYFAKFLGYRGSSKESDVFVMNWNDSQDRPDVVIEALEAFAIYIENNRKEDNFV